ncbi:MAG: hypothetical protein GC159_04670 [Phycisphaera sp.]|nr:hypothetical protein [Phycisphaera sp.]
MSDETTDEPNDVSPDASDTAGKASRSNRGALVLLTLLVVGGGVWFLRGPSLEQIMKDNFKGAHSVTNRVLDGEGTDADYRQLLQAYTRMSTLTPPKGDAASWKEKTDALVAAAQLLVDGKKDEGVAALETAADCKACHKVHR